MQPRQRTGRRQSAHRSRWLPAALLIGVLSLLVAGTAGLAPTTSAADEPADGVRIVYFYGDGCPYCAAEERFLDDLTARQSQVTVEAHEVWYNAAGRRLYQEYAANYGIEPRAVPATFIGEHVWIGFSPSIGEQIEAVVLAELDRIAPPPNDSAATIDIRSLAGSTWPASHCSSRPA